MAIDVPPQEPPAIVAPIRIDHSCVIGAAAYYRLPPELIVGIRIQEGGTVGRYSVNQNKTVDLGPMQINSMHVKTFAKYGITSKHLLDDECTNLYAGGWMLHQEIENAKGDMWRGIGNYHSRTPKFHNRYRAAVLQRMEMLYAKYAPYVAWLRANTIRMRLKLDAQDAVAAQAAAKLAETGERASAGHSLISRSEP